jgi:hypothetical protein
MVMEMALYVKHLSKLCYSGYEEYSWGCKKTPYTYNLQHHHRCRPTAEHPLLPKLSLSGKPDPVSEGW